MEKNKLTPEEIEAMQPASTRRIMQRPVAEDEKWFNRPTPKEAIAVPGAKTLEEATGFRHFDAGQVAVIEDIRRKGRNSEGASEVSAFTPERKEKAASAFTCTPPAPLTPAQVASAQKMVPITEHVITADDLTVEKRHWIDRLHDWLLDATTFHRKNR